MIDIATRFIILFILMSTSVFSQDVAYERIYAMLRSSENEQGEALLREYIKAKSIVNPSAYIELGTIYYNKAVANFLSDDEEVTVSYLDSAVLYYNKAIQVLSEVHLEKDEVLYRDFDKGRSRRSVRLNDVRNSLEDKIKKIKRRSHKLQKKTTSDSTSITLKTGAGKYYGLIIGISNYQDTELLLNQPTQDAELLKKALVENYTFEKEDVITLLNPNRQEILRQMFLLRKKITKKDNLLIFYAGHGYWDEEASQGYWWPVDATPDDPSFWLSNSDIREQLRGIKSAHSLIISDACFSGGILKTRNAGEIRNAPIDIVLLYKQPSRRAMTSGNMSAVPDKSVFFEYLKKRLDENKEKYLPSQVLFDNIRRGVISNSLILPQDGVILDTGDEGGDFIFIRRQ